MPTMHNRARSAEAAHRAYVTRACELMGVDLIGPTRHSPGIVATHWHNGFGHSVIAADTWAGARKQLDAWREQRAAT